MACPFLPSKNGHLRWATFRGAGPGSSDGELYHYDGVSWTGLTLPAYSAMFGIWGTGASDVFAVGYGPVILHWDGASWTELDSGVAGATERLNAVWGNGAGDVFAVGRSGAIVHHTGDPATEMISSTTAGLQAISGTSGADVHAVSGAARLHYDGTAWSSTASSGWQDVWAEHATSVYTVGAYGSIQHYDGATWSSMTSGTTASLSAVWASGAGPVYAVGDSGTIGYYPGTGTVWSAMTSGTTVNLNDVWGSSATDVYAVGLGTILHYDGAAWSKVSSAGGYYLQGV